MSTNPSGQSKRAILEIDESLCNGCGVCLPSCAEGALRLENGKVRIIEDKLCDGLGACLGHCPRGALRIIEREADPFSEHAVMEKAAKKTAKNSCPGQAAATLPGLGDGAVEPDMPNSPGLASTDKHWPLKLQLVPPTAPFLKNAHWLLTADCAPAACSSFAQRYLPGKVQLLLCPKLENKDAIVSKLVELLQTNPPVDITLARMEVPCCCLPQLLQQAQEQAGTQIPVRTAVLSRNGLEKMPSLGRPGAGL